MIYRRKTATYDAIQYLGDISHKAIIAFLGYEPAQITISPGPLDIQGQLCYPGDYILRNGGGFLVYKSASFEAMFEPMPS